MTKSNRSVDGTRAEMPIVALPEEEPRQQDLSKAITTLLLLAIVACALLTGMGVWVKLFWIGWVFAR